MNMRQNRGFTLIELLVALAITSMLTLILYTSFSGLTGSAGALQDYSVRYRQTVLFLNQLANDISGAFYSPTLPFSDFSLTEKNMGGESISELSFSCFSHQFIDVDPRGTDIMRVTYRPDMDDDGKISIIREIDLNFQIPGYEETMKERFLTDIASFSVKAVTGEDTEDSEWKIGEKLKLPERLRVSIVFPNGRTLKEEFFLRLSGEVSKFGNSGKRNR